jgi:hypothetical protein
LKSAKLLFWSAVAYAILLVLARGIFPSTAIPTVSLVGIPLIVIAVIISRDLARRATNPTAIRTTASLTGFKENPVGFMSGQIRVAASASNSYFDSVVRSRLKELLITKIGLETGLEKDTIRRALSDLKDGPKLLHDDELYRILYGSAPGTGPARIRNIEAAIDMIGAWKG